MQSCAYGMGTSPAVIAAVFVCALPLVAHAGTRYVAHTGSDGPNCGFGAATACRSISQAIALANPGDTILVGPGAYGDLNLNGVLGEPREERGAPGCSCVLAMNKNVIIISSGGAAVTIIEARSVRAVQNVVVLSAGGEFGRTAGQGVHGDGNRSQRRQREVRWPRHRHRRGGREGAWQPRAFFTRCTPWRHGIP